MLIYRPHSVSGFEKIQQSSSLFYELNYNVNDNELFTKSTVLVKSLSTHTTININVTETRVLINSLFIIAYITARVKKNSCRRPVIALKFKDVVTMMGDQPTDLVDGRC